MRMIIFMRKPWYESPYQPSLGKVFPLKARWINQQYLTAFTGINSQLPEYFKRDSEQGEEYFFIIHPDSERYYKDIGVDDKHRQCFATATSSNRTLLTWCKDKNQEIEKIFFAKTSLDKKVWGVDRTITYRQAVRSIGVHNILQSMSDALPSNFLYFPEVLSLVPNRNMISKDENVQAAARGALIIREISEDLISSWSFEII